VSLHGEEAELPFFFFMTSAIINYVTSFSKLFFFSCTAGGEIGQSKVQPRTKDTGVVRRVERIRRSNNSSHNSSQAEKHRHSLQVFFFCFFFFFAPNQAGTSSSSISGGF
jgi:hypothetical protein